MYLAFRGIIPQKEWHHSPRLKNNNGDTVALYLVKNEITPQDEWLFGKIANTEELYGICCICLTEDK